MLNKILGLAGLFLCALMCPAADRAKNSKGDFVVMDLIKEAVTSWLSLNKTIVEIVPP